MTKREKLAFITGFFEGEGCISIVWPRKKNSFILKMGISNTNLGLLKLVKNDLGIGRIQLKRPGRRNNFKIYYYSVTGPKALVVLKKLLPFLKGKKKEAILGIEFQEEKSNRRRLYGDSYPILREIKIKREKMYWEMRTLKSAGKTRIKEVR